MAFSKKAAKPINFSGVISNIDKTGPFSGKDKVSVQKDNVSVRKLSNYYTYKLTLDNDESKTFINNVPVKHEFSFDTGQRISLKAFAAKDAGVFNVLLKSMAKQMSPEEIMEIQKMMENKESPKKVEPRRQKM